MDPPRLMEELLRVAERLGLEVRIQPFATPPVRAGGLCWVQGRQLVLLDANAPPVERATVLAEALCTLDLEQLYIAPEARVAVEMARRRLREHASDAGPGRRLDLRRAKPGLRSTGPRRGPRSD